MADYRNLVEYKVVQFMGDHFEIWYFPLDADNDQIKEWYNMLIKRTLEWSTKRSTE
jgi:hypothetical protein